jgi:hypothetical protein
MNYFVGHQMERMLWKLLRIVPDKLMINLLFLKSYGYFPNLENPRIFDEKIQWYKLYYRDPLMTTLTDKYEVRDYVENKGFGSLLNEFYGVYESVDEIDFSGLPMSFVLKATHGSGMNLLCKDKNNLNWPECCHLMNRWLKTEYFYYGREWAYKNIKPRLICEKYLQNEESDDLMDYKFYCYNNKPEVLFVCTGRFSPEGVRQNYYDMNWNRIYVCKGRPCSELEIEKPATFDAMRSVAESLCEGFPFVRVDLYSEKDRIIFGELTFYPDNGWMPFTPDRYNYFFGDFFVLPEKKHTGFFNKANHASRKCL